VRAAVLPVLLVPEEDWRGIGEVGRSVRRKAEPQGRGEGGNRRGRARMRMGQDEPLLYDGWGT